MDTRDYSKNYWGQSQAIKTTDLVLVKSDWTPVSLDAETLEDLINYDPVETNLSISITGADEANEWQNTIYNMILTMTGLIGAENVVATVTLPADIDYVASVDGTPSWQTISWTIAELMWNYTRQFTIKWDTQGMFELTAVLTTDTPNIGTTTASKEIEVVEAPAEPIVWCPDPAANNYNPNADPEDEDNYDLCEYDWS